MKYFAWHDDDVFGPNFGSEKYVAKFNVHEVYTQHLALKTQPLALLKQFTLLACTTHERTHTKHNHNAKWMQK